MGINHSTEDFLVTNRIPHNSQQSDHGGAVRRYYGECLRFRGVELREPNRSPKNKRDRKGNSDLVRIHFDNAVNGDDDNIHSMQPMTLKQLRTRIEHYESAGKCTLELLRARKEANRMAHCRC